LPRGRRRVASALGGTAAFILRDAAKARLLRV
jgi:hypothetical protein